MPTVRVMSTAVLYTFISIAKNSRMSSPQKRNEETKNKKYTLGLNTIIVTKHVITYSECPQTILCVHEINTLRKGTTITAHVCDQFNVKIFILAKLNCVHKNITWKCYVDQF